MQDLKCSSCVLMLWQWECEQSPQSVSFSRRQRNAESKSSFTCVCVCAGYRYIIYRLAWLQDIHEAVIQLEAEAQARLLFE